MRLVLKKAVVVRLVTGVNTSGMRIVASVTMVVAIRPGARRTVVTTAAFMTYVAKGNVALT